MDKEELLQKMNKLPLEHSLVLSQIIMEELSFSEVAGINNIPEEKVRKVYREALGMLSENENK